MAEEMKSLHLSGHSSVLCSSHWRHCDAGDGGDAAAEGAVAAAAAFAAGADVTSVGCAGMCHCGRYCWRHPGSEHGSRP